VDFYDFLIISGYTLDSDSNSISLLRRGSVGRVVFDFVFDFPPLKNTAGGQPQ